jgi:hypothetical protein
VLHTADTTQATVDQIRDLVGRLGEEGPAPLFVCDAGYDPIALSHATADVRATVLVRIGSNRVSYSDLPPRTEGTIGRPRRHGHPLRLRRPGHLARPRRRDHHQQLVVLGCDRQPHHRDLGDPRRTEGSDEQV